MNFKQKKIVTVALAVANLSFALTASAIATYAWFKASVNTQVSSKSMDITCAEPDGLKYLILKYDDNLKAGVSSTNPNDFTLPAYDTYITEKNQYANVIVRAQINLDSFSTTNKQFTVDVSRLGSTFLYDGKVQQYTSNVIQFKSTIYKYFDVDANEGAGAWVDNPSSHDSINDAGTDAQKYATASAYFADKPSATTFVPILYGSDGTKRINRGDDADKRTIHLIPDLPTGVNINAVVIYIECTYNPDLVDYYVQTNNTTGSAKYSLEGDISTIRFDSIIRTAGTSNATGKYIKVESTALTADGQFLPTKDLGSNSGKIMKGSNVNSAHAVSGNNVASTDVVINDATTGEPKSIDSTDTIDEDAFYLKNYPAETKQSLQSKDGYYIGNATATNGVATSATLSDDYKNTIDYNSGSAIIKGKGSGTSNMQLRYNNSEFYYYNNSSGGVGQTVDLYRYTENVAEMPTLSSIAITTPATKTTFYTGQTFDKSGLVVTATYSNGSTAVVTGSCTYTGESPLPTSIIGATFTGSHICSNKKVNISYSEFGGEAKTTSYTISVIARTLTSISFTGSVSTTNFYVGDSLTSSNLSGIVVTAHYNDSSSEDVTASVTWNVGSNSSVSIPYSLSSAGSYNVTASYGGQTTSTISAIKVRAKTLTIDKTSMTVYIGDTGTISVTHTATVTVSRTNGTSSTATFTPSTLSYSRSDTNAETSTVTVTGVAAGSITLTFSVSSPSGFTSKTCTITVKQAPIDTLDINATSLSLSGSYTSSSKTVTTSAGASIGITWTDLCVQSSNMQFKNSTGVLYSTTTTGEYIKTITVDYSSGSSYVVYGSTNGSSWTSLGTFNADHTFNLTESNGYKYFKVTYSGGWVQLPGISVQYYVVSVTDVTGVHTQPSSYYVGETPNVNDFLLDVTYSDDTTGTVVPTSITLNTSSAGNNISGTATYSEATGTKTASFTINIIIRPVTSISVSLSVSTVEAGGSATATATCLPSNATNKNVTWTSSDTSVATIDSSTGAITAVAAGTCTFTATAADGQGATGTSSTFTVTAPAVKYSVTYQPNGGTGSNYVVSNISSGSSHSLVAFATTGFTAPSGKQFKCWSVGGNERDPGYSITVTSNVTVTAVWEDIPSGYTVTFNGNGASGSMSNVSASGSYTLPANGFTVPSGKSFAGWSVGSNTSTTVYAAGASVTINSNTTIYARWRVTTTYTFTSKSWADSTSHWTSGKDGNQFTANQGIQITTGVSGANATTKTSHTLISKIVVQYCTNASKGVGSIVVQVGTNTSKSFSVTKPSSGGTTLKNATFTYSTYETGTVKVTGNCTTNSVYIWSVAITYVE